MITTTAGKIAYLSYLKAQALHFAFGSGSTPWGTSVDTNYQAPEFGAYQQLPVDISTITVTNLQTSVVGVEGSPEDPHDYYLNRTTGRLYLSDGFAASPGTTMRYQFRYGSNAESAGATGLIAQQVQKLCLVKLFVTPDANGTITVQGTKYSITETPTKYLYLASTLNGEDYNGTIREVGVFMNPTLVSGLPDGQVKFSNAQIVDHGTLVALGNYPSLVKNEVTRFQATFILTLP